MKTICLFFLIIFFSCNTVTKNKSSTSADTDLISAADTLDPNIKHTNYADSLIKAQQAIAFGDLKFGITKAQYNKSKNRFSAEIGEYHYQFEPHFNHEGKLYKLYISEISLDANYLNTDVEKQTYNLISAISSKYGDGEKGTINYPSILDLQSGYYYKVQTWHIGSKTIDVGVGEISAGAEYYACAVIEDENMGAEQDEWDSNKSSAKQIKDASNF